MRLFDEFYDAAKLTMGGTWIGLFAGAAMGEAHKGAAVGAVLGFGTYLQTVSNRIAAEAEAPAAKL